MHVVSVTITHNIAWRGGHFRFSDHILHNINSTVINCVSVTILLITLGGQLYSWSVGHLVNYNTKGPTMRASILLSFINIIYAIRINSNCRVIGVADNGDEDINEDDNACVESATN